jgi:hypothetical protein
VDEPFEEYFSWLHLLESYCKRNLTLAVDRLYALRGVADNAKQARHDRYFHDYGVWEDHLPSQLLWSQCDTDSDGFLDLPTWCWAATGGRKAWVKLGLEPQYNRQDIATVLKVGILGSLISVGHITEVSFTSRLASLERRERNILGHSLTFLHEGYFVDSVIEYNTRIYIIEDTSQTPQIQGLAMYDTIPSSPARCFFTATSTRNPWDWQKYEKDLELKDDVSQHQEAKDLADTTRCCNWNT